MKIKFANWLCKLFDCCIIYNCYSTTPNFATNNSFVHPLSRHGKTPVAEPNCWLRCSKRSNPTALAVAASASSVERNGSTWNWELWGCRMVKTFGHGYCDKIVLVEECWVKTYGWWWSFSMANIMAHPIWLSWAPTGMAGFWGLPQRVPSKFAASKIFQNNCVLPFHDGFFPAPNGFETEWQTSRGISTQHCTVADGVLSNGRSNI